VSVNGGGGGEEDKLVKLIEGAPIELTASDLEGLTKVRDGAFKYSAVTSVELPNTVT
jgi:hypothetical protein